jgi:hypothetical protein
VVRPAAGQCGEAAALLLSCTGQRIDLRQMPLKIAMASESVQKERLSMTTCRR